MKIGIYLEGSPEMGGGFFQSLKASLLFFDIKKYNSQIELIITKNETKEYLLKAQIKNKLFKLSLQKVDWIQTRSMTHPYVLSMK